MKKKSVSDLLLERYQPQAPQAEDEFTVRQAARTWGLNSTRAAQMRIDRMMADGEVKRRPFGAKYLYKFTKANK